MILHTLKMAVQTEEVPAELFQDIFTVTGVNPDGKKFDKGAHPQLLRNLSCHTVADLAIVCFAVNRLICKSETYEMDLSLDIASEVYPLKTGDKFSMCLRSTLRRDGKPDDGEYDQSGEGSVLDDYEYGMSGKVFQYDYESNGKV